MEVTDRLSEGPDRATRRVARHLRSVAGLSGALAFALFTEVRLRVAVLPWYRPGTASWHRVWNREMRTWGVRTARITRLCAGLRMEVEGSVPERGRYVVVANHQSSIDIPFLIDVLRPLNLKFVAFDGLRRGKPAVSLGLRAGGSVFVGKRNPREDLRALRAFAGSLRENDGTAVIFPEGVRAHDGVMIPFQMAGARILREVSGLPILPVAHDGLWRARTIRTAHRMVGATVRFRIFDPVPSERFESDPRGAYREIEDTIRDAVEEMRGGA